MKGIEGTARAWAWMVTGGTAGLTALPLALAWDRLPEPIAVRWGLDGTPNGPMPKLVLIAVCWAILGLFAWLASRRVPAGQESRSAAGGSLGLMAFGAMTMPAIAVLCVILNLDRPNWTQAEPLTATRLALLFMPAALALLGVFAARVASGPGRSDDEPRSSTVAGAVERATASNTLQMRGQTSNVWVGQAVNRWALAAMAALGATALYLALQGQLVLALLQLVAVVVLELLSSIRVTVDAQEVTIRYGRLGWVRQRISMARVGAASVTQVGALSPYGWGYRGSLRLLRRAAVVVRSGAGLRLDLKDDRWFIVTVDDAESASSLINRFRGAGELPA